MARKVYIDVIIDDKGTTKRLAVDAKKLQGSLEKTNESVQTTDRRIKGVAGASANATKNFSKMQQGISGGLVPAYATLAAQVFAVSAAFNFLKDAGSLAQLQQGQIAYSAAVGTSMRSLTKDIQDATDGQLGFRDAAQAASIGIASGLSPEQITRLGTAAKDASAILGRDLVDSFNRLTRGVTKAEPELLDELGIILRLEEATNNYKQALNITGELSAFQRSQAVTAEVLTQVEEKYSRVLAVTGASANKFAQLSATFEEVVNKLRLFAVDFLTPIAEILKEFPALIALAFAPFTKTVLTAALPGLENLQANLDSVADKAKKSFEESAKASEKFRAELAGISNNVALKQRLQEEISLESKNALATVKIRKNSLLQQVKDGQILTDKQIKYVEQQLKKKTGAYNISDKKILKSLETTLTKMKAFNASSSSKMSRDFNLAIERMKAGLGSLVVTGKAAFAGLAAFAVRAGAAITAALSAISWISLIATLGTLVYSFFRTEKQVTETANAFDYYSNKINNTIAESNEFITVQNIMNDTLETGNQVIEAYGNKLNNISSLKIAEVFKESGDELLTLTKQFKEANDALEDAAFSKEMQAIATSAGAANMALGGGFVMPAAPIADELVAMKERAKEARISFKQYIDQLAEEGNLSNVGEVVRLLQDEADVLSKIKNERFQTNKAVIAYREALANIDQEGFTEDLIRTRQAVIDLARNITALTQVQRDNLRASDATFNKYLPVDEYEQLINNLKEEKRLIEAVAETNKGLTTSEQQRLNVIARQLEIARSIAYTQAIAGAANQKIDIAEQKLSIGKTRLVKERIGLEANLAKNAVQIFEAEQKIAVAQALNANRQKEINELKASGNAEDALKADLMQQDLNARERAILQHEGELELLELKEESLRRQKDEVLQIADAMSQAFETSLQQSIADIIKGKDAGLKETILGIAESTLNAAADTLSKIITQNIMGGLFGQQDPADKMASAIETATTNGAQVTQQTLLTSFEQGGTMVAQKIQAALAGKPIPTGTPGTTAPVGTPGSATPTVPTGGGGAQVGVLGAFANSLKEVVKPSTQKVTIEDPATGEVSETESIKTLPQRLGDVFFSFTDIVGSIFSKDSDFLAGLGGILSQGLSGIGGLLSSAFQGIAGGGGIGAAFSGIFSSMFGARYGGIMQGYATGGIARGRQAGYPAILHGTEAVVPLPNGNSIPVEMRNGGAGGTNNVTVNVSVDQNGNSQTNTQMDNQQAGMLGKAISAAVQEELQRQKRPGGMLSPYGAA